jgi:hypothetical protein
MELTQSSIGATTAGARRGRVVPSPEGRTEQKRLVSIALTRPLIGAGFAAASDY